MYARRSGTLLAVPAKSVRPNGKKKKKETRAGFHYAASTTETKNNVSKRSSYTRARARPSPCGRPNGYIYKPFRRRRYSRASDKNDVGRPHLRKTRRFI